MLLIAVKIKPFFLNCESLAHSLNVSKSKVFSDYDADQVVPKQFNAGITRYLIFIFIVSKRFFVANFTFPLYTASTKNNVEEKPLPITPHDEFKVK